MILIFLTRCVFVGFLECKISVFPKKKLFLLDPNGKQHSKLIRNLDLFLNNWHVIKSEGKMQNN